MARFEEIERMFSDLIDASKSVLSDLECSEIQEYIEVGEYGLALRTAVAIHAEENKKANPQAKILIRLLAESMKIDPILLLQRLP